MPFHYELFTKEPIPVLIERFQKKFEESPASGIPGFIFDNPYLNPNYSALIRGNVSETGFQIYRKIAYHELRTSFSLSLKLTGQFESIEGGTRIYYSIGINLFYLYFFWNTFTFCLGSLLILSLDRIWIFGLIFVPICIFIFVLSVLTEKWCLQKAISNLVPDSKPAIQSEKISPSA